MNYKIQIVVTYDAMSYSLEYLHIVLSNLI
jgi:hypothetical protein